jgi:hypothetical protein
LVNFVNEVLAPEDPSVALGSVILVLMEVVELLISLGILELHVSSLYEGGDLFKLFVCVLLVVLDDAGEDFSQMLVEVGGDGAFLLGGGVELVFDLLQRFRADTHFTRLFKNI